MDRTDWPELHKRLEELFPRCKICLASDVTQFFPDGSIVTGSADNTLACEVCIIVDQNRGDYSFALLCDSLGENVRLLPPESAGSSSLSNLISVLWPKLWEEAFGNDYFASSFTFTKRVCLIVHSLAAPKEKVEAILRGLGFMPDVIDDRRWLENHLTNRSV